MAGMTDEQARAFLAAGTRTGKLAVTRRDGAPMVVPIWLVIADDGDLIFMTGAGTIRGRAIRRDPRVSLCVDDETSPYAFVRVDGIVTISDDLDEMLSWSTAIAARYMGAERAEEFGRRNAVAGERLG